MGALPDTFGQLTQLKRLLMANNQLTALPETFGQLTQLGQLFMDNNQLTALPETFGQLTQLKLLRMDNNQLTALPGRFDQQTQLGDRQLRMFLVRLRLTQICKTLTDIVMCRRRYRPVVPEVRTRLG